MKRIQTLFILLVILAIMFTACSPDGGGDVALKVTGDIAKESGWTEAEIKAMDTMEVEATNKKGEADTYTGVLITDFLANVYPSDEASALVFVGDDGSTAEVTLKELKACPDCIVSIRNQGGFSIVMPGFDKKLQVKGVIEIQVK